MLLKSFDYVISFFSLLSEEISGLLYAKDITINFKNKIKSANKIFFKFIIANLK